MQRGNMERGNMHETDKRKRCTWQRHGNEDQGKGTMNEPKKKQRGNMKEGLDERAKETEYMNDRND